MRIAIVTTGRFHVLDLARELDALGHEVAFYCCVPKSRAIKFGLPAQCHRGLLPLVAPLVALLRKGPRRLKPQLDELLLGVIDALVARIIAPCDVFIGMSGLSIKSAKAARSKYRARVLIERGSRHILSQKAILDALPAATGRPATVPDYAVRRELASYQAADLVVVPSKHAEQSFIDLGYPADRLFRNPYGVDLAMFPPTPAPPAAPPTLLFVGSWSLQKGCDLLTEAWQRLPGVRLVHVGPIGDAPVPKAAGFTQVPPVDQWRLMKYHAGAHVFVLASRQDGFGLVLAQALACGLPVVCTDRTGGEDLREFLDDPGWITVVPHGNASLLAEAIAGALKQAQRQQGPRDFLGHARQALGWPAYGRRYDRRILAWCPTGTHSAQ